MSMVSISPKTLKQLRIQKGFRTQEEAVAKTVELDETGRGVGVRQWSRREASKEPFVRVRRNTADLIAKALGVGVEDLGKSSASYADASGTMQEAGYHRISLWLSKDVRLNYLWVTHHYDVSVMDLIDAAPWMFTLLADMSLADRGGRLKEAEASFEDAMAKLPVHLGHGSVARCDFENAVGDENDSLANRDVFGKVLLASKNAVCDPFDPSVTNPFIEFLRRTAETIDSDAIDPERLEPSYGGSMPHWPIYQFWLDQLTDGDQWARFAVENVKGVVDRLPGDLKGQARTAERVVWLSEQIPPEMRAREKERLAKLMAKLDL